MNILTLSSIGVSVPSSNACLMPSAMGLAGPGRVAESSAMAVRTTPGWYARTVTPWLVVAPARQFVQWLSAALEVQ